MSNKQELLTDDLAIAIVTVIDAALSESRSLEPDWRPLQAALPAAECAGFMWMDRVELPGDRVEVYRHGITRRWLHIGHSGRFYGFVRGAYVTVDSPAALTSAFTGLAAFAGDRTTRFDASYVASKVAELRARGIRLGI